MNKRTWALFLALSLAACSNTPTQEQAPAGVEDRSPTAATQAPQPPPPTPVVQAAQTPVNRGVDLTAVTTAKPGPSPLRDPANILSKRSIFYDFDRFEVRDEFRPLVEAHAKYLRENPNAKMLIQGNTDERGGREYNLALGQRRSEGVKRMMVLLGARDAQIEAVSLGEEKPRAAGSSEEAWAQNRRSDILYGDEF